MSEHPSPSPPSLFSFWPLTAQLERPHTRWGTGSSLCSLLCWWALRTLWRIHTDTVLPNFLGRARLKCDSGVSGEIRRRGAAAVCPTGRVITSASLDQPMICTQPSQGTPHTPGTWATLRDGFQSLWGHCQQAESMSSPWRLQPVLLEHLRSVWTYQTSKCVKKIVPQRTTWEGISDSSWNKQRVN